MGGQAVRLSTQYASVGEFLSAGGVASYGDGVVLIAGKQYYCKNKTLRALDARGTGVTAPGALRWDFTQYTVVTNTANATLNIVDCDEMLAIGRRVKTALRIDIPAGDGANAVEVALPLLSSGLNNDTENFTIIYKNESVSEPDVVASWFLSTDQSFSHYYRVYPSLTRYGQVNGFTRTLLPADIIAGSPTAASVKYTKVKISCIPGKAQSIIFYGITSGASSPPVCTLICDDGLLSTYTRIVPYLNKKNIKGGFGIIKKFIDVNSLYMTGKMLDEVYLAGHDVMPHGSQDLKATTSIAGALADIDDNADYLINRGYFDGSNLYVYPYGDYYHLDSIPGVINHLKQRGIDAAWLASGGTDVVVGGYGAHMIYRYELAASTTLLQVQTVLDFALQHCLSVSFMYHDVVDAGATGGAMNIAVFKSIVDEICTRNNDGRIIYCKPTDFIRAIGITSDFL